MTEYEKLAQFDELSPEVLEAAFPDWGPAPTDHWGPDILGDGFKARTLPLAPDKFGPIVATIIKHDPSEDTDAANRFETVPPTFTMLYVHGWNDYFFQRELARHVSGAGGAFYALDLHRFGRSFRSGQTFGAIDSLSDYDADFDAAIRVIRAEHPDLPLVIMGHSMGGLVTTLWVGRHPGVAAGLILNSPWLSHFPDPLTTAVARVRKLIHPRLSETFLKRSLPMRESDIYARNLGEWRDPVPPRLRDWQHDPSMRGWQVEPAWKRPTGRHMRFGWMGAIFEGHAQISSGFRVDVPVLLALSASSPATSTWNPLMHFQDVVLDTNAIMRHGPQLAKSVTVARFNGIHDLVLSVPPVRMQFWDTFHNWLHMQGFTTDEVFFRMDEGVRGAICP